MKESVSPLKLKETTPLCDGTEPGPERWPFHLPNSQDKKKLKKIKKIKKKNTKIIVLHALPHQPVPPPHVLNALHLPILWPKTLCWIPMWSASPDNGLVLHGIDSRNSLLTEQSHMILRVNFHCPVSLVFSFWNGQVRKQTPLFELQCRQLDSV